LQRVLRPGARLALTTPGPCEDHGRWDAWNSLCIQFAFPRRLIAERRIRFVHVGRYVRIPESALRDFIGAGLVQPMRRSRGSVA